MAQVGHNISSIVSVVKSSPSSAESIGNSAGSSVGNDDNGMNNIAFSDVMENQSEAEKAPPNTLKGEGDGAPEEVAEGGDLLPQDVIDGLSSTDDGKELPGDGASLPLLAIAVAGDSAAGNSKDTVITGTSGESAVAKQEAEPISVQGQYRLVTAAAPVTGVEQGQPGTREIPVVAATVGAATVGAAVVGSEDVSEVPAQNPVTVSKDVGEGSKLAPNTVAAAVSQASVTATSAEHTVLNGAPVTPAVAKPNSEAAALGTTEVATPNSEAAALGTTEVARQLAAAKTVQPRGKPSEGASSTAVAGVVTTTAAPVESGSGLPTGPQAQQPPLTRQGQAMIAAAAAEGAAAVPTASVAEGLLAMTSAGSASTVAPPQVAAESQSGYRQLATAPFQTAVPIEVGKPGWSDGVMQKVMWMSSQQINRAEIALDPPELGPLQVRVATQGDQTTVTFTSAHGSVREALDQGVSRLREMMESQGLDLAEVDVSDQRQFGHGDQGSQSREDESDRDVDSDDSEALTELNSRTVGSMMTASASLVDSYV